MDAAAEDETFFRLDNEVVCQNGPVCLFLPFQACHGVWFRIGYKNLDLKRTHMNNQTNNQINTSLVLR